MACDGRQRASVLAELRQGMVMPVQGVQSGPVVRTTHNGLVVVTRLSHVAVHRQLRQTPPDVCRRRSRRNGSRSTPGGACQLTAGQYVDSASSSRVEPRPYCRAARSSTTLRRTNITARLQVVKPPVSASGPRQPPVITSARRGSVRGADPPAALTETGLAASRTWASHPERRTPMA